MPKVVDAARRRQEIFDAVFTVVVEQGIEQASLRRVAEAAGLVVGSVRHYFETQRDLLTGAADELADRIAARLERHRARLDGLDGVDGTDTAARRAVLVDMAAELLPLTDESRRETTVWLEFVVSARTDPVLRDAAARLLDGPLRLGRIAFASAGLPPAAAELAAQRFAAVVDGLTLRAVLGGGDLTPRTARAVLREHLL